MTATLPKTPEPDTLELLRRATAFLQHARSHVGLPDVVDGMVAVHGLDAAVEYLLRIVARHPEMEAVSGRSFDIIDLAGLAGELGAFLKHHHQLALPYLSEVKQLRQVRNLVQHGVVDPRAELRRFEAVVVRLYGRLVPALFGLDPDAIRTSALVADDHARARLVAAERAIDAGDYIAAVAEARDAFEWARSQRARQGAGVRLWGQPALLEAQAQGEHTQWFYREVIDELELLGLEVQPARFRRYRHIVAHLPQDLCADWRGNLVMQRPWERADADFCYHFAADAILRWQSVEYGPLYPRREGGAEAERWEWFGDVRVLRGSEGVVFAGDGEAWVETLYVDTTTKDRLLALGELAEVEHRVEVRQHGADIRDLTERLHEVRIRASVLVNRPPVWQVVVAYERVPMSSRPRVLPKDGTELVDERPSVNELDADQLRSALGGVVTASNIDKIIAKRSAAGGVSRYQQIEGIKSLSGGEFAAIASRLRI